MGKSTVWVFSIFRKKAIGYVKYVWVSAVRTVFGKISAYKEWVNIFFGIRSSGMVNRRKKYVTFKIVISTFLSYSGLCGRVRCLSMKYNAIQNVPMSEATGQTTRYSVTKFWTSIVVFLNIMEDAHY